MSFQLRALFDELSFDPFRNLTPFSEDIQFIHEHIFEPGEHIRDYVRHEHIAHACRLWLQGDKSHNQPCVFGSIAAAQTYSGVSHLHFCVLTHDDIQRMNDQEISEVIKRERLAWKRRSLLWRPESSTPAHGFVLIVVSPRLAFAAPNEALRKFAELLLGLWSATESQEPSGRVHFETLYLRNPRDGSYLRFTFGIDYFQAQGDGRWYQDHRFPGGIAFTANSAGHMRRYREWYKGLEEQERWVLKRAMQTIGNSAVTKWGRATWLKTLPRDGVPHVTDVVCPFNTISDGEKAYLEGIDWTKYGGRLHTDHSIRPEFFNADPDVPDASRGVEYIQDFTYIYDNRERDHFRFILGEPVSESEVFAETGEPTSWTTIVGPRPRGALGIDELFPDDDPRVRKFLQECEEKWGGYSSGQ